MVLWVLKLVDAIPHLKAALPNPSAPQAQASATALLLVKPCAQS